MCASQGACECNGVWTPSILYVLQYHVEDFPVFCSDILRTLQTGAARGVNRAIVGPPGCGKSTVLEALELIYKCGAKPDRSNSFPLSSILDQEVLRWQEFKWSPIAC